MSRITGRNTRIYLSSVLGGALSQFIYIKEWEENTSFDGIDVTSFGDTQMTYLAGETDCSGSFSGFVDTATNQALLASLDGKARDFILYPDYTDLSKYSSGTILLSCTRSYSRTGAVELSGNWYAAGPVGRSL